MARLYTRARSPFFYIAYRDATGAIRRESTRFRKDSRHDTRAARRLLNQRTEEERGQSSPLASDWGRWVPQWLESHSAGKPSTLTVYKARWVSVLTFLTERQIHFPAQVRREHAFDFVAWRKSGKTFRPVRHNTAIHELACFQMIMNEAVRRDYVLKNPLLALRIGTEPRKIKQEISPEHLSMIAAELESGRWPEEMKIMYAIGLYAGRRISETRINLSTVDTERGEFLVRVKGGKTKGKPIHPMLLPLMKKLKAEGREWTHTIAPVHACRYWGRLFKHLRLSYSFHCFRVTLISAARRAGLDRWTVMQLVDHASATIHEVYNRYSESDLRGSLERLFPSGPQRIEALPQVSCDPPQGAAHPPSASQGSCASNREAQGA